MRSASTRTLTIEVDEDTFLRVQQAARRTGRSLERVIGQILDLSLSPASATKKVEWRAAVAKLQHDSRESLRKRLQSRLNDEELARMRFLLEANHERDLTIDESEELDRLQIRMVEVSTERTAAAYLLRATSRQNPRE